MTVRDDVPPWIFHWNPRKPVFPGRLGRLIPLRRRVNNFGDLLGPRIVRLLMQQRGAVDLGLEAPRRLFSVGSVLHFAADDDIVWGSGVNGKVSQSSLGFERLDVRAVRGPRTAAILRDKGIAVPEVYGDPALLLRDLDQDFAGWSLDKRHKITIVPNLNDLSTLGRTADVLDPRGRVDDCLERIARSEVVVASSLHGIILGELAGAKVVPFRATREHIFKYDDYYEGTGRARPEFAPDLDSALDLAAGAASVSDPLKNWDARALLDAFPWDALTTGRE